MFNVVRRLKLNTTTYIHVMALDGIVNVNSQFTLALFLGLAWYPNTGPASFLPDNGGGNADRSCLAGPVMEEHLIACHVYSFSSFLFSSLIAAALKQAIKISKNGRESEDARLGVSASLVRVNLAALRVGILLSGIGSVSGCGFLTMALVDLVQMKLGVLGCGSFHTIAAIAPLLTLVPLSLLVYVSLALYALTR